MPESTDDGSPADAPPHSVEEALGWLRAHFRGERSDTLQATYQVELSGEGGGVFWARIDGGRFSSGEGKTPGPDVVFRLSATDFYSLLSARANPELLYMEDRVRVQGSMSVALKLRALFLSAEPA